MRRLSASLLLLAATAACATTPPPVVVAKPEPPPEPPPPAPPPPTIERAWRLAYMDGVQEGKSLTPTLTLAPDATAGLTASGFAGCGAFAGPAPLTGISVRFQSLAPTPPAEPCTPEARVLENQFVATLSATRRLTIRGGYLVLIDEGGKDRAYFAPG